jgi:hypothetical protein
LHAKVSMTDSILQDELLAEAGLRNERLLQHPALVERLLPFDPSEPGLTGPPRSPELCPALVWSLKRADVPRGAFILPDWDWRESRPFGTVESNEKYTADYFDSPRRLSRQDRALYSQTYQHLFDLDSASRIDLESREWIVFNAVPGVRSSAYFVSSMKPKLGAAIHRAAFVSDQLSHPCFRFRRAL